MPSRREAGKSNVHTYRLFSEHFPDIDLDAANEAEARKLLVKYYIASFSPVSEEDIAWWTAFPKREVKQILESFQDSLVSVKVSGLENDQLILSVDEKALKFVRLPKKPVVNLLPSLDPYLMGYKERQRYLLPEHTEMVFDRSGNVTTSILVNGRIVGVWDFSEGEKPLVKLFMLTKVDTNTMKKIRLKAQEIGRFIADKEVQIKECDSMVPLTERTAGGVMSPLRDS